MTPAEYAKRYGRNHGSVKKWLENGRVCGAENIGEEWDIPPDAKVRYECRKKKNRTVNDDVYDILHALKTNYYVDDKCLFLSQSDFKDRLTLLAERGLIEKSESPRDDVTSNGFRLTAEGLSLAKERKKEFIERFQSVASKINNPIAIVLAEEFLKMAFDAVV